MCDIVNMVVSVLGFHTLAGKVEEYDGNQKIRKYSSRNLLRRRMLNVNLMYKDLVIGAKCDIDKNFFCRISSCDVCIESHGGWSLIVILVARVIGLEM